jgi:rare lipoprotein A
MSEKSGLRTGILIVGLLWASLLLFNACTKSAPKPVTAPGKPKPYRVGKTWYQPIPDAKGFSQTGTASWYGKKFHGRKTSSGETYNMYAMTAAHKTLPFGTYLRVRNLDNDKQIVVKVNDRGPFVRSRIIDLSYTAADKLDMLGTGTASVKIVALGKTRSSPDKKETTVTFEPVDYYKGNFTFQVGAFRDKNNALRLKEKLDQTYKNAHITPYDNGQEILYRVRVGKASSLEQANEYEKILIQNGFKDIFIIAE